MTQADPRSKSPFLDMDKARAKLDKAAHGVVDGAKKGGKKGLKLVVAFRVRARVAAFA